MPTYVDSIWRHADGSATFVATDGWCESNPREDEDLDPVAIIGTNVGLWGPDHGHEDWRHDAIRSAFEHYGRGEYEKIERYLRIVHGCPAVLFASVTGSSQSDWNDLIGAVFPDPDGDPDHFVPDDAAAYLDAVMAEYGEHFAGECYGLAHAPADIVATTLTLELEPAWAEIYTLTTESVWGFHGVKYARQSVIDTFGAVEPEPTDLYVEIP